MITVNTRCRCPRHRFPIDILSQCVWLSFRCCLSYCDVEVTAATCWAPSPPPNHKIGWSPARKNGWGLTASRIRFYEVSVLIQSVEHQLSGCVGNRADVLLASF